MRAVLTALILVSCGSDATSVTPMSPDRLLAEIQKNGAAEYNSGVLGPPTAVDGPNRLMEGHLDISGVVAVATLFREEWMATAECQPRDRCFAVGGWAVRPYSPDGLTSDQASAWTRIQTKMR